MTKRCTCDYFGEGPCPVHPDPSRTAEDQAPSPGLFRHYRGGLYLLLCVAETHNHNGDLDVVYASMERGAWRTRPVRRETLATKTRGTIPSSGRTARSDLGLCSNATRPNTSSRDREHLATSLMRQMRQAIRGRPRRSQRLLRPGEDSSLPSALFSGAKASEEAMTSDDLDRELEAMAQEILRQEEQPFTITVGSLLVARMEGQARGHKFRSAEMRAERLAIVARYPPGTFSEDLTR